MTITQAARVLGSTARMLRYRESLGLLPAPRRGGGRRVYGDQELAAAALAGQLEARFDVTPKALSFALRVLADSDVEAAVRRLGGLAHRLAPAPIAALDFDAAKARRLLSGEESVSR
ncbi:MAG TPA: MerR family transcriptional regulator [Mycobacteriales bacterium]|nr:MerR family transcriptional regulator [Mycobacteriales bacterium]